MEQFQYTVIINSICLSENEGYIRISGGLYMIAEFGTYVYTYIHAVGICMSNNSSIITNVQKYKLTLVTLSPSVVDADWLVGSLHGNTGIFPKSYVTEIK